MVNKTKYQLLYFNIYIYKQLSNEAAHAQNMGIGSYNFTLKRLGLNLAVEIRFAWDIISYPLRHYTRPAIVALSYLPTHSVNSYPSLPLVTEYKERKSNKFRYIYIETDPGTRSQYGHSVLRSHVENFFYDKGYK